MTLGANHTPVASLILACPPRSNQVAQWALSQGLGKGDAIALVMPSCPDYGESEPRSDLLSVASAVGNKCHVGARFRIIMSRNA